MGTHPPLLAELPAPPPGKTGWPWTTQGPLAAADESWPRISIVTPSYNQGRFIEETIRSVLLQGYPNLEYIVMDGGSTDESPAVIQKYAAWIDYWVSQPDKGQSDAISQGFARATGDVIAWLNSDDLYLPGALAAVGTAYRANPGTIVAGDVLNFHQDTGHRRLVTHQDITLSQVVRFWKGRVWHQPGLLFPRVHYVKTQGLDESLRYAMDYDLLCQLLAIASVSYCGFLVVQFRIHSVSKTTLQAGVGFLLENSRVSQRYWHHLPAGERGGCERELTRRLVRRAGRQLLNGRLGRAHALLEEAWRTSWRETVFNALVETIRLGRTRESVEEKSDHQS
jgi:hypothetical protein